MKGEQKSQSVSQPQPASLTVAATPIIKIQSDPADKKLIESLRENITKLTKQLETTETKRSQSEEECSRLKKEVINSQVKIEILNKKAASVASASAGSESALKEYIDKNSALERTLSEFQQRIELETGTYQAILAVVLGKASRINSGKDLTTDDCFNLVSRFFLSQ